jgi:CheY-like chemotaxis protein
MAFRQVFKREPYNILTAMSAREALDLLARQPVAVLITDHRMPGMTGIELLRDRRRTLAFRF